MSLIDDLYSYIESKFKPNEPILLSELESADVKVVNIRQQVKRLTESGRLMRYDTGIYYIPKKTIIGTFSVPSFDDVIKKKYLKEGERWCGYVGGILFANKLALTTQIPGSYEIYTNKARTEYRETELGNIKIIIRKPYCEINEANMLTLQFLDLLKEIVDISEVEGEELTKRLADYMKKKNISFSSMNQFLAYYPDRIYKNMYEVGLLNGISA